MSIARRIAITLAQTSMRLLIVLFISLFALISTFGSPEPIKQALQDTQAYDRVVPAIVESSARSNDNPVFSDPNVQKLAEKAFPAATIEQQTGILIDSLYVWLNGDIPAPQFNIDLSKERARLAEQLSIYAIERLSQLPVCD